MKDDRPGNGKAADFTIAYDDAVKALASMNNLAVDRQDPLLCVITLNNLYLEALNGRMLKHEKVMKETMLEVVRGTVTRFDEVVGLLGSNTVENSMTMIKSHQQAMTEHGEAMKNLARTVMVFSIGSLGATFLALFILLFWLART